MLYKHSYNKELKQMLNYEHKSRELSHLHLLLDLNL